MSHDSTQTTIALSSGIELFEEPGTSDQVAQHAADWFKRYLRDTSAPPGRRRPPPPTGQSP